MFLVVYDYENSSGMIKEHVVICEFETRELAEKAVLGLNDAFPSTANFRVETVEMFDDSNTYLDLISIAMDKASHILDREIFRKIRRCWRG